MAFGAAKAVLFIEVSSLQGVLIRGVLLYSQYSNAKNHNQEKFSVCSGF